MNLNIKLYGLAVAAIMGGALASCTNELNEPGYGINGGKGGIVKAPEITAWSGNQTFAQTNGIATRGAFMNANQYNGWHCPPNVDLTEQELAELKELLSPGVPTVNDVILPWPNYFVQQVYKGKAPEEAYTPTDINGNPVNGTTIVGSDQMDLLLAFNSDANTTWWNPSLGQWGENERIDYDHVNNFNRGDNTNYPGQCGCGRTHLGTTLMLDMNAEGVDFDKQFGFHESFGTSHNYCNYIIVQYKGEWYVGFDYEMHKSEAQNANEAKNVERDWNFTDWIVKITPGWNSPFDFPEGHPRYPDGCDWCQENATTLEGLFGVRWRSGVVDPGTPDPEQPEQPGDDKCCDDCGDNCTPEHGCEKCPDGCGDDCKCDYVTPDPDQPGTDDPAKPGDKPALNPTDKKHMNEVEVNLSINDTHEQYTIEDLITKLSIHVRYGHDVEVKIPVPTMHLVEADDLNIVEAHYALAESNGKATYQVGDYNVSLSVNFEKAAEQIDGVDVTYIVVRTEGITQEVIDYCYNKWGDGLNFEIWNYFCWNETDGNGNIIESVQPNEEQIKELQGWLNQATIRFDVCNPQRDDCGSACPDYYINAFNNLLNGSVNDADCTVSIVEGQKNYFDEEYHEGAHLNGSPYNKTFANKNADKNSEGYHAHMKN